MTDGRSGSVAVVGHGDGWPTALASLAVGAAFFSLWFWLLPQWLGFRVETAGAARWRWLAALPSVLGFAVSCTVSESAPTVEPPVSVGVVGFGSICAGNATLHAPILDRLRAVS